MPAEPCRTRSQRRHPTTASPRAVALVLATVLIASCVPTPQPAKEPASTPAAGDEGAWPRIVRDQPLPADRPLRAAFLLVDGVYNTELIAPLDVLDHVQYQTQPGIEVFTVSHDGGAVTTAEGLVIQADHSFENAPAADILVVASAMHSRDTDLEDKALIAWVRDTGSKARFVVSLCWGAFVLAKAGLLDGYAATTFPGDQDALAGQFPAIDVRRGVSFVHDGARITSEGGVRSYQAAMYLVDHLYATAVATGIGGGLLIDWPPAAGARRPVVIAPAAHASTH